MEGLKRLWVVSMLLNAGYLSAQHFGQIAMGPYAGIHAAKINPALTATSKYLWHVNLIGGWGNINNNYLSLHLPYSAYKFINNGMPPQYKTDQGNPTWDERWLREHLNGSRKHGSAGAMIYGPSFYVKIGNFRVGLLTDATAGARIHGVSENMAHAAYQQLDTGRGAFDLFNLNNGGDQDRISKFTFSGNAWATAGITGSYNIPLKWKREMQVGATIKRAWGFGGGFFQTDAIRITRVNKDSMQLDRTNIRVGEYRERGRGTGVDLGVGYTLRKKEWMQNGEYKKKHPDYVMQLGFSLLDIGSILYPDVTVTTVRNNGPVGMNVTEARNRYSNQEPGVQLINTVMGDIPNLVTSTQNLRIGLPTRLALSADYQFRKNWFIQSQWVQSLRSNYGISARHASYFMIGPRYESDLFAFTLPVMLEYDYRSLRAAASMRIGPLYLGTNSLMSMLYTRGFRDADFFIGIAFGDLPGKWINRYLKLKEDKAKRKKGMDCEKV